MSAPPRITRADLELALEIRQGNVTQAADDLGVHRMEVYRKIQTYGIDLGRYRVGVTFSSAGVTVDAPHDVSLQHHADRATDTQTATWNAPGFVGKLGTVIEQAGAAAVDLGREIAERAKRKAANQPPRLTPEQNRQVHEMRRKINSRFNVDLSASDVIQIFHKNYWSMFDDALDTFFVVRAQDGE